MSNDQSQPTDGIHPIGKTAGGNMAFSTRAPPPGMFSIGIVGLFGMLSAGIIDIATKLGLKAEGCDSCGCCSCCGCCGCCESSDGSDGCSHFCHCCCSCRVPGPVPGVLTEGRASLAPNQVHVTHF